MKFACNINGVNFFGGKKLFSLQAATSDTMLNSTSSVFSATTELPLHFTDINFSFALTLMTCLGVAGVVGTFGNLLILVSVAKQRELRNVESVFIVNLACCDLYVTMFAEPLSIVSEWTVVQKVIAVFALLHSFVAVSCLSLGFLDCLEPFLRVTSVLDGICYALEGGERLFAIKILVTGWIFF